MVRVIVTEVAGCIAKLVIKGHANSAQRGQDLVCAGVSSIGVGLLNALEEYNMDVAIKMNEGLIEIDVKDMENHDLQIIINVGIIQLKTMEISYSNYIRVERKV